MKVFWSIDDVNNAMKGGVLAIGNFDGVHLGHQALIEKTLSLSPDHAHGVLTFSPHPASILQKNHALFSLTTDQEKIDEFTKCGVDVAILHRIDEAFLKISPEEFIEDMLVRRLAIKHVVVGDDFTFGSYAKGNIDHLRDFGKKYGFVTHVIESVMVNGIRCSSTAIRNYLRLGQLQEARAMLGRDFSLAGTVVPGQKKGASLGFRTANIAPPRGFQLAHCIYATVARIGSKDYLSATNVGVRPTITADKKLVVETHIFDQDFDLYGQTLRIFFIEMLRPEEKFTSVNELQKHIAQDCERVRALARANPTRFHVKD